VRTESRVTLIASLGLLLAACGGGGTASNPAPAPTPAPVTSISVTLSSTAPMIALSNVASVDFTGQTALMGKTVSLASMVDADLNAVAADAQSYFDADLSDPNTIQITVPIPPVGEVTAIVSAATAIANASADQAVTVYVYSTAGDSGDGEDMFSPLTATVDPNANTITVSVPEQYFQPTSGSYVANLKIGVATASTTPSPGPAEAVRTTITTASEQAVALAAAATTTGVSIRCPLPSCIETSRYNPLRYLVGQPRNHLGIDFQAKVPTAIYVPSGGLPERAITPQQYQSEKGGKCKSITVLTRSHCAAGVLLVINYVTYKIRLLHLTSLDPTNTMNLVFNGSVITSASNTTASTPVALTGNTGVPGTPFHLHYEILAGIVKVCGMGNVNCKYVKGATDPFPFIATQLSLSIVSAAPPEYSFLVSAADYANTSVSSAVAPPLNAPNTDIENGGNPPSSGAPASGFYDPTRKTCFDSLDPNYFDFGKATPPASFTGLMFAGTNTNREAGSYCVAWGNQVTGTEHFVASGVVEAVAKYSADATVSVARDPLSGASGLVSWLQN
jgi:hypothetical protein